MVSFRTSEVLPCVGFLAEYNLQGYQWVGGLKKAPIYITFVYFCILLLQEGEKMGLKMIKIKCLDSCGVVVVGF